MNKLYFKYGTVNSSKTANLLMIRHNYLEQGFSVWCGKSYLDTREVGVISTRAGVEEAKCETITPDYDFSKITEDIILIDEAQFLSKEQVEELFRISYNKPVICFGLLTDFRQTLFEGSKALVELAESLEKIKTVCQCGRAANFTIRVDEQGDRVFGGDQIEAGYHYKAVCKRCL